MNSACHNLLTGHNALLIEDDPLTIGWARHAASESFPELDLVVESCDAVLTWLDDSVARRERMPHIILLDLKLPKLNGLAVLRKLRMHAATRDVPIVTFSSVHTQADILMSYQVGANSFVSRPTDQQQFTEFLSEQLAYWLQPRQRELVLVPR